MDGQSWSDAATVRPPRWYFMPQQVQGSQAHPVYDLALDKLVQYAGGLSALEDVAVACNSGLNTDVWYFPRQEPINPNDPTASPLHVYYTPPVGCADHSRLLAYLLGCTGVTAQVKYLWSGPAEGSSAESARILFCAGSTVGSPNGTLVATFPVARPAHDSAAIDPHLAFHAVARTAIGVFDPPYGLVGIPPV